MTQTLSEIRSCLAAFGLRPKHRLGQNFLHDQNQMDRVVAAAAIVPGDVVLEVGAGTGSLSQRVLAAGGRLVAVEIDGDLEPILRQQLSSFGEKVTVVTTDVLAGKHAIHPAVSAALVAAADEPGDCGVAAGAARTFKLVANLPYSIACPLLANLLTQRVGGLTMDSAVVMVQREVADRLGAGPGNKNYGALSVLAQSVSAVTRIATVGPGCFWPKPKVDSAILGLKRLPDPLTDNVAGLVQTLGRVLFGQRRKQLGTVLGRGRTLPEGVNPQHRPEQLTVEQWVVLSKALNRADADGSPRSG